MSSPVTQVQFYEEMQKLRADFQGMHSRLRESMTDGFKELGEKLDAHAKEDAAIERRVVVIEATQKIEKEIAARRGAWAGLLASSGIMIGWQLVKQVFVKTP